MMTPNQILLFNKPFRVMSQFTQLDGKSTLAEFIQEPEIYPAGRLDFDSEGLLLLTGNGRLQHHLTDPRHKQPKTYWVQIEGDISESGLQRLRRGVNLKDGTTLPAKAKRFAPPSDLWPRHPPIRQRANIPTCWIELIITEGRNRQVRRMTAAVGHPTLRLIRYAIGDWSLDSLLPGKRRIETVSDQLLKSALERKPKHKKNYQRSRAK